MPRDSAVVVEQIGPIFAGEIRRKRVDRLRARKHWRRHLDEVYVKINGETHYLWRAVDHEGKVLESVATKTRDRKVALDCLTKTMKRHGRTQAKITDRLRSYGAAVKDLGRGDDREIGRWLNSRAENSHLPFRRRERAMLRFRRMRTLQNVRLSSRHGPQPLPYRKTSPKPQQIQTLPRNRSCRVARPCREMTFRRGWGNGDWFAFV